MPHAALPDGKTLIFMQHGRSAGDVYYITTIREPIERVLSNYEAWAHRADTPSSNGSITIMVPTWAWSNATLASRA